MRDLVIHLHGEGFERAYQALTLAASARSAGQAVAVVLAFGALRALAEDRLGDPMPGPDLWTAKRAELRGAPPIAQLLASARALGVAFWASDAVADMTGVDPDQLTGKVARVSLPQIVERQQQAQVLYL